MNLELRGGRIAVGVGPDAKLELVAAPPRPARVRGVDGLRVVDASVFPSVPNGNIYAPVMMVAEKAADLIDSEARRGPA